MREQKLLELDEAHLGGRDRAATLARAAARNHWRLARRRRVRVARARALRDQKRGAAHLASTGRQLRGRECGCQLAREALHRAGTIGCTARTLGRGRWHHLARRWNCLRPGATTGDECARGDAHWARAGSSFRRLGQLVRWRCPKSQRP